MKLLTVYKASAGSGKTFTLAVKYIELLVRQPDNFKNILAVTFTNKATGEMKQRILSQLYGIAEGLPDSKDYLQRVQDDTGMDVATIRNNCRVALTLILHSYSYFRVQTIDAFFQQVLRNLQHELGLNANLRVSLEDELVMAEAVDDLIDSLNLKAPELKWITQYINEKIEDDLSWNVTSQIKGFGKQIFGDVYKENADALNNLSDKDISDYRDEMRRLQKEAENKIKQLGDDFYTFLNNNGISVADLKKNTPNYFHKLQTLHKDCFSTKDIYNGTVKGTVTDPNNWLSKANQGKIAYNLLEAMSHMVSHAEAERPKLIRQLKSAKASAAYIYQLRLLKSIAERVKLNNHDAFQYQLSDTQTLLHDLIKHQDSPFIYEKIGSRLDYIMIDEFQDTGTVQWANFKVLLMECISRHAGSLIVGDVKQSIYRWRGGDWKILNDFEHEVSEKLFEEEPLDDNRRSARNIVLFNNAFFTYAAPLAYDDRKNQTTKQDQIENIYKKVAQNVIKKDETGLVEIHILPKDSDEEVMLSQTVGIVKRLLDGGAKPADIGILIRSNKDIQNFADYFLKALPDVPLISDEAFKLYSSIAVSAIIDALRVMSDESDKLALATLVRLWLADIQHEADAEYRMVEASPDFDALLPDGFRALDRKKLLSLPLTDIAEHIYRCFRLDTLEGQGAYVCTFFDLLAEAVGKGCTSPRTFLKEWDNRLYKKAIESDDIRGISLLTIHKSKGLEFKHVILPYCDWTLEVATKDSTVWCKPGVEPYSKLPIVPVAFSKSNMVGTIYEDTYNEEHFQNIVDNLNMLYVAFTRPKQNLFVIGNASGADKRSQLIQQVLPLLKDKLDCSLDIDDATGAMDFSFGSLMVETDKEKTTENVFELKSEPLQFNLESFESNAKIRQLNQSRNFVTGDDEEKRQRQYMLTGSILHALLSRIHTVKDIGPELDKMERSGIIYNGDISRVDLLHRLEKGLATPQVSDWFSDRWTVFNECSILAYDADQQLIAPTRPDRVITDGKQTIVIDFKFGKPYQKHEQQVQGYMRKLTGMGMPGVEGYLWYVYNNKVKQVWL